MQTLWKSDFQYILKYLLKFNFILVELMPITLSPFHIFSHKFNLTHLYWSVNIVKDIDI